MTNSRQKGKRIERKAVHYLRSLGFEGAERTQQYCGTDGTADVRCLDLELHIEVKGDTSIGLGTKALEDACVQAARDAGNGKPWVFLWWEHRKGWRLTVRNAEGVPWTCAGDLDIKNYLERYRRMG